MKIIPYLIVHQVEKCVTFLEAVFEAEILGKLVRPNGSVMHTEIKISDNHIMLGEPMGEFEAMPSTFFLYVDDVEECFDRALKSGGELVMEMADQPHAGVKYGGVKDPSGNIWWIGCQIEEISWEEQQRRIDATAHLWSNDEA